MKTLFLFVLTISLPMLLSAQDYFSESGMPMNPEQPRDGIYDRKIHKEKPLLPYDHVREADVFWEKRIWREIDLREKMNHIFRYPKAPFINILLEEARTGNITLYSVWDDEFSMPLPPEKVQCIGTTIDTIEIFHPETFEPEREVVKNELAPDDIIRYRLKEVWFFDE